MNSPTDYFSWHYTYAPKKLLKIAANFLLFFYHYFSVKILLRTIFSPWKRLTVEKGPGFSLDNFFYVLSFNLISRSIGAIVRVLILLAFLIIETLTSLFFLFFIPLWLILPGLSFPLFLTLKEPPDPALKLSGKKITDQKEIFEFLFTTPMGKFLFSRLGLSPDKINSLISATATSKQSPISLPPQETSSANYFFQLAKTWSPFKNLLFADNLDENDVLAVCQWFERIEKENRQKTRFWELENLLSIGKIGEDWTYGFTINLDKYSEDLTRPLPFTHHLVGREKESRQIEQVLSRATSNNVLLIGQPGVGRNTIILEFARRVKDGQVTPSLSHKRVLSLDLNALLGTSKSPAQAKSTTKTILDEAFQAGNIILVIENFDKYVSTGSGREDLSDLFSNATAKGLQFIGISDPEAFQKYIFPNQEVTKIFEKVEVNPPTPEQALIILQDTTPLYEKRNQIFILYQALVEVIEKSDQYVVDIPFPEKAIDLLDETGVWAARQKIKVITPLEVNQVLAEKTKIPLGELKGEEKEKLEHLEEFLHQRIINQEIAVTQIAKAMRRSRLGIAQKDKPIGTFLFLGPTGVGKTETAKALAESYFGDEKRMLRFDMSEYQGDDALKKVLGSQETKEPGLIASAIRKNPFSLLLLDEIEKAHSEILNLFLVILDEGYFTDAFGRKIDCRNLIIIGTSNAGGEFIRQEINKGTKIEELQVKVLDYVQKEGIFSPEFLNRFDAVVVYQPLSKDHLKAVARLLLEGLNKRLAEKDISVKITDQLVEAVVELGYSPTLGARPMKRVIQDRIEDQIAQRMLKEEIKRGQEVAVSLDVKD